MASSSRILGAGPTCEAMASTEEKQIDRISDLPELLLLHILSFLSTPHVARTSLLSRHFCHLWEASDSPFLNLRQKISNDNHDFVSMADRALLRRDRSCRLHRLLLSVPWASDITTSYLSSLFLKAKSLGVQHLWINLRSEKFVDIFPLILSIKTLASLIISLQINSRLRKHQFVLPSTISLPFLKSLTLELRWIDFEMLNELVSRIHSLKELSLKFMLLEAFNLTSQTITRLKLTIESFIRTDKTIRLSMPNLETLHFKCVMCMPLFSDEMPQLRKATIIVDDHCKYGVGGTTSLLKCLKNVQDLKLDLKEDRAERHPFHMLVEPGEVLPNFYNLKSIRLCCCFHEENIEDLISLVQSCPVLQSLELVHKGPNMRFAPKEKRRMWKSKLPRNSEGNYQHAEFTDLHINENKIELVKRLAKKQSSKRVKIQK